MKITLAAATAVAAATLLFSTPAEAAPQNVRGIAVVSENEQLQEGDALHRQLRPMEALNVFREILNDNPEDHGALWRSAREAVSLGMLAQSDGLRQQWYAEAEDFARRAIAADPEHDQGRLWLAIALGRRALHEGIRTRVALAGEIRAEATTILDRDPLNAGAHHVLGQWNAEVMRVGGFSRFIARNMLGGKEFDDASWEAAEEHLQEAVRLSPESLIHHLELGRLYLDTRRPDEARACFREVLERPAQEPTDPLHKQEAQDLLKQLS